MRDASPEGTLEAREDSGTPAGVQAFFGSDPVTVVTG